MDAIACVSEESFLSASSSSSTVHRHAVVDLPQHLQTDAMRRRAGAGDTSSTRLSHILGQIASVDLTRRKHSIQKGLRRRLLYPLLTIVFPENAQLPRDDCQSTESRHPNEWSELKLSVSLSSPCSPHHTHSAKCSFTLPLSWSYHFPSSTLIYLHSMLDA